MKKILVVILLTVISLYSQQKIPAHLEVKAGIGIPLGDFADNDKSAASIGYGLGASYYLPITYFLGLESELFVSYNSMNAVDLEKIYQNVDVGNWINNFGLIGLRFDTKITNSSSFFIGGKGGIIFSITPEIEISNGFSNYAKQESANSIGFAFQLNAGIMINRFIFSFSYLNGGENDFETEIRVNNNFSKFKFKGKISLLNLLLGISL